MNLRLKTIILLSSFLAAFLVSIFLYVVARDVQLSGFEQLDKVNASRNMDRLFSVLDSQIKDIKVLVIDWAAWDDTYNYMSDRNDEYVASNITPTSFYPPLNLESIVYVAPSGEFVYQSSFDHEKDQFVPASPELLEAITPGSPIMEVLDSGDIFLGLMRLSDGVIIVSAYPILTSFGEGPARGVLVMTKRLTSDMMQRVSEVVQIESSVIPMEVAEKDPALAAILPELRSSSSHVVEVVNRETIHGFALIRDLHGEPVLLLRATMPREVFLSGMSGQANTLFYVLIATLLLGAGLMVVMERNFFKRVSRVTGEIRKVADSGSLERRMPVEGGDEITDLASLMNDMLESIQVGQEELEAALNHKDLLVREVHHRVKNNLQALTSLIDYRMAVIGDTQARKTLVEEKGSIWAMALVHQQLYESEDLMEINFSDYLSALARRLKSSYSAEDTIQVRVNAENVSINLDTALPVGLIVNELMANAFKHAFSPGDKGEISVDFFKEGFSYGMTVSDDGKGLPEDFSFGSSSSFGLNLVRSLVEQLDGDLEFTRGTGTTFTIRFSEYTECRDTSV